MALPNSLSSLYLLIEANSSDTYSLDLALGQVSDFARRDELIVARAAAIARNYGIAKLVSEKVRRQTLNFLLLIETAIIPPAKALENPCRGTGTYRKKKFAKAMKGAESVLRYLDHQFDGKVFTLGDIVSFADIGLLCVLLDIFIIFWHPAVLEPYHNVTRWLTTILNQPEVERLVGSPNLCEKPYEFEARAQKRKSELVEWGDHESATVEHGKGETKKSPTRAPRAPAKPTFNLRRFRRSYKSQGSVAAMQYFWQYFNAVEFSIWYCVYGNPRTITLTSVSASFMDDMAERFSAFSGKAFASICLFGDDNHSTISGVWVWKGSDLIFSSEELLHYYGSFHWTKLDPNDSKTRTLVNEYFTLEGSFDGMAPHRGIILR